MIPRKIKYPPVLYVRCVEKEQIGEHREGTLWNINLDLITIARLYQHPPKL